MNGQRDTFIRQLYRHGVPKSVIAVCFGLSDSSVGRICAGAPVVPSLMETTIHTMHRAYGKLVPSSLPWRRIKPREVVR